MAKRARTETGSRTDNDEHIEATEFFLNALDEKRTKVAKQVGTLEGELSVLENHKNKVVRLTNEMKKEYAEKKAELDVAIQQLADTKADHTSQYHNFNKKCEEGLKTNRDIIHQEWTNHHNRIEADAEAQRKKMAAELSAHNKLMAAEKAKHVKLQTDLKGCEALLQMAHGDLKELHDQRHAAEEDVRRLESVAKQEKEKEPPRRSYSSGESSTHRNATKCPTPGLMGPIGAIGASANVKVISRPQGPKVPQVLITSYTNEPNGTLVEVDGIKWKKGGRGAWWPAWTGRSGHGAKQRQHDKLALKKGSMNW